MANYNKKISETTIRIGEVRFSYANVFSSRKKNENDDGEGKYSVMLLIPKSNTGAKKLIDEATEAAKQNGVSAKWNGKMPSAAKLHLPLRDGDDEYPEDDTYKDMWFLNASSTQKPGVRVLENGQMAEALDNEDFYSGCWGCAAIAMYPYSSNGNVGVAVGLNNVIKTRDDERLGGGRSADQDFGDLTSGDSYLD